MEEITIKVMSWKEYIENLDLTHWRWNYEPWGDRDYVEIDEHLYAIPIYARDIYEDPNLDVVSLGNRLVAVSWDSFIGDITFIKETEDDYDDAIAGWLVVEKIRDDLYIVKGQVYPTLEELLEDWKE